MLFDPAHGSVQQERLGFDIFRKWGPALHKPTGWVPRILNATEEQRADLYRRFHRVVDISDQQSLGDQVHDGLSINGALARSRRNLDPIPLRSLPCERYTGCTTPRPSAQGAAPMPSPTVEEVET